MEAMVLKMVGQRIRDLRRQTGLSQEELGEKAGFHFSYIGGVERAEKNITLVNLQKIADALGVPINDLFVYSKYTSNKNNDKDNLLSSIHEKLISMEKSDLRKVQLFLSDFF
ncbi:helix-turn-helix domain-containing protein [Paenibacillus elgii]|uniref:helix-turn-helix domain-containing protein n=1 Tax=Paenibacillus elgii TaxID=189691 RepID=UPI000248DB07|nr:helix-turn-helix transcriptional regulator [Paenibacillus elgii]